MARKEETILVVNAEPQMRRVLRSVLARGGYTTSKAKTCEEAAGLTSKERPSLVLIDVNLARKSGMQTAQEIRAASDIPIIVLTARNAERDKVLALDAGADDCIARPFGTEELLARIRAVLRRCSHKDCVAPFVSRDLIIDFGRRRLTVRSKDVHLTPKEFEVLKHLVANREKPMTHRRLLQLVWGPAYGEDFEILYVIISQLRKKIERDSAHPKYILTVPWMGYRFWLPDKK